jgi:hypothetical protein
VSVFAAVYAEIRAFLGFCEKSSGWFKKLLLCPPELRGARTYAALGRDLTIKRLRFAQSGPHCVCAKLSDRAVWAIGTRQGLRARALVVIVHSLSRPLEFTAVTAT